MNGKLLTLYLEKEELWFASESGAHVAFESLDDAVNGDSAVRAVDTAILAVT